jgi:hypothetical protein
MSSSATPERARSVSTITSGTTCRAPARRRREASQLVDGVSRIPAAWLGPERSHLHRGRHVVDGAAASVSCGWAARTVRHAASTSLL